MKDGCPFCDYAGPSEVLYTGSSCFVIEPLNPVVDGHLLVIPKEHVVPTGYSTLVGDACGVAAYYAWLLHDSGDERYASWNLILSNGQPATQTVPHVHVHVVPRREGDGLALPWDGMGAEKLRERLRDSSLSR